VVDDRDILCAKCFLPSMSTATTGLKNFWAITLGTKTERTTTMMSSVYWATLIK